MSTYHPEYKAGSLDGVEPLIRLWLLRLLNRPGIIKERFYKSHSFYLGGGVLNSLAEIFDIDMEDCKTERDDIDYTEVFKRFDKLYATAEKKVKDASTPECLARNIRRLAELARLSATDCRILEIAILIHTEEILDNTGNLLGGLTSKQVFEVLSVSLDLPQKEIRRSLSKTGTLSKSGLLSLEGSSLYLGDKLELLSPNFANNMVSLDADPVVLLRDVVFPSAPPHLTTDDFPHLAKELGVLQPYLKLSIATERKGVNILLHGEPGTGKSQLAKILAVETGCDLFEVASEDEEGNPRVGSKRSRAYQAAQNILSNQNIMILFDEIEDVFNSGGLWKDESIYTQHSPKAWVNQRLEENTTPTLWLGNTINGMDPAFIRRFDMIINLPVPPRRQRQKIIRATCSDLLSDQEIERISTVETLAPAVVTRASSVVAAIRDELPKTELAPSLELIINYTLEAQGHERIQRYDPNRLPETYDSAFIHADADIEGIAAGLKKTKTGRLCLYGPPGTGKTAFGRWLAEQLEIPLLVKRGSDLMSMWVGETEKNIARSFRQAETEEAVLLVDEVEGFLKDRRQARSRWEITGVNEMLTRMESFPGVFIASTNLLDSLDQAALRRFDLKIKFDFLLPCQSQALLESHCNNLKLDTPDKALTARIGRLNNLTLGDFAAVVRRHRFQPVSTAADMVTALEEECSLKENFKRPIGFS